MGLLRTPAQLLEAVPIVKRAPVLWVADDSEVERHLWYYWWVQAERLLS